MKNILAHIMVGIVLMGSLPAFADSNLDTGLKWEYYDEYYSFIEGIRRYNLLSYSLTRDKDTQSEFQWRQDSNLEYQRFSGKLTFMGEMETAPPLEIREEGNKIYLIITPEYAESEGLYEVDENAVETRMEKPGFENGYYPEIPCREIKIEEDMPVLLYDFDAEVGDSYTTLLYGSLLNTVHVVSTSFREDILGGVKEVMILADYTIRHFHLNYDPDAEWKGGFTLSYLEKIGNITDGTFTVLNPYWYDAAAMTFFETVINNVYDSEGNIVYKGRGFDPAADTGGIDDLTEDQTNNKTDKVFDLLGREVAKTVPGSIYIRDGKKFVAE